MISVIIPTYNEEQIISNLIAYLRKVDIHQNITEIIVCDGGSKDDTMIEAAKAGANVVESDKGRAKQMNTGASVAKGDILYFLHADTVPPAEFSDLIVNAYKNGYQCGCFNLRFNIDHWFLKANAYFTRFNFNLFRFGDQSLFVSRETFSCAQGFNERLIILEDQEIISRIRRHGKFTVIPKPVTTSSRKYVTNGIYKTQFVYFIIYILFKLGINQNTLLKIYRTLIKQDKL